MSNFRIFLLSILSVLILTFISCESKNENNIQFYHWKQNLSIDQKRESLMDSLNTQQIYLRYFDIDQGIPTSKISISNLPDSTIEVIPCVFITNSTFEQVSDIDKLAQNIYKLIVDISSTHSINYSQVQFDCDWTQTTRYSFFDFLEKYTALEEETIIISSTLRLHQVKYTDQMGVPPVDRVALMCYNMGDLEDINETNSIFQPSVLKQYVNKESHYPLPIDIAMPIYSWAVVYRFGVLQSISQVSYNSLISNEKIKLTSSNRFQVLENHYFEGKYYYTDDIIRYENIEIDSLIAAIDIVTPLKEKNSQLILFDLSTHNLLNYTNEDLQKIGQCFH